jgi:hypothetical protein
LATYFRTPPGGKFFVGLKRFGAPKSRFEDVHVVEEGGRRKLQVSSGYGLEVERLSPVSKIFSFE